MKFGPVYIFGVTLGNTTSTAHWDVIKIRASMGLIYAKETHFICCIKYIDLSYYTSQPVTAFNIRHPRESLSAVHFTCRNPRPGVVPSGVALALNNPACSDEHVTYRIPETPKREPGVKLAICTKLAYGNRNAEMLIEFMELYKYLGVDKFVTYFLKDLNKDARKVLEYYASTGILDLYYFEPAEEGTVQTSIIYPFVPFTIHSLCTQRSFRCRKRGVTKAPIELITKIGPRMDCLKRVGTTLFPW